MILYKIYICRTLNEYINIKNHFIKKGFKLNNNEFDASNYDLLTTLEDFGFINFIIDNKKQYYWRYPSCLSEEVKKINANIILRQMKLNNITK